jgi:hypothetical protein
MLNRRAAAAVLGVVLVGVLAWWLLALRPWPFVGERASLQRRVDSSVVAMDDYLVRVEARMRLQLLETAMADGRRSTALRPSYRLIEDLLEPVLAREEQESRLALGSELDDLLPDLSRDRGAARARIERLNDMLRSPAGPGRQGDGE